MWEWWQHNIILIWYPNLLQIKIQCNVLVTLCTHLELGIQAPFCEGLKYILKQCLINGLVAHSPGNTPEFPRFPPIPPSQKGRGIWKGNFLGQHAHERTKEIPRDVIKLPLVRVRVSEIVLLKADVQIAMCSTHETHHWIGHNTLKRGWWVLFQLQMNQKWQKCGQNPENVTRFPPVVPVTRGNFQSLVGNSLKL